MRYSNMSDLLFPRAVDPAAYSLNQTNCIFEYDAEYGNGTFTPAGSQNAICNKQWAPINGTFTTPIRDHNVANQASTMTYAASSTYRNRSVYGSPGGNHVPWSHTGNVAQLPILPSTATGVTLAFVGAPASSALVTSNTVTAGEKPYSFGLYGSILRFGDSTGTMIPIANPIKQVVGAGAIVSVYSITEGGVVLIATSERYHAKGYTWAGGTFGRATYFGSSTTSYGINFQNPGSMAYYSMYGQAMNQAQIQAWRDYLAARWLGVTLQP